jgi:NAD-dependent dihydropyrimidine dehydrogenase PreA subunit
MIARRPAPRLPTVDADRCTGCGRCVAACEPRVLSLETRPDWRKSAVLHGAGDCTGCSLCAWRCPFGAIEMQRPASDPA